MIYRFGIFDFDADSGQLRKSGRAVSLERQPARVLATLLAHAGELVSREELRDSVWDRQTHVDFDRGLAYCLSEIRRALGDRSDSPRFIQTLPRRGYQFIAPVTVVGPAPSPDVDASKAPGDPAPTTGPAEQSGLGRRLPPVRILAAASMALLVLVAAWFALDRRQDVVLVAVSVFDNETGIAEYDRSVAGLSDLVVTSLADLAPGRLAVIGNAEVLRKPRNIRNLQAVADGTHADYVLLGQLQQGEQGLRFITHFVRLSDMTHLKANRLPVADNRLSGLEAAVVEEFRRAVRQHLLTPSGN